MPREVNNKAKSNAQYIQSKYVKDQLVRGENHL